MRNPQCNARTGMCECQNDVSGRWDGAACDRCVYGYWGTRCTDECDCSGHGSCDAVSCYCSSDPVNGFFTGSTCDTCKAGYIGASCNIQDVAITRVVRTMRFFPTDASSTLDPANMTMGALNPIAPVAAVDEKSNSLLVGGRTVVEIDISGSDLNFMRYANSTFFTGPGCFANRKGDVAFAFVDSSYHYFLMQPMNFRDDGCDLPIRLIMVYRTTHLYFATHSLNTPFNGTGDMLFNYTVRVVAAASQSDNGEYGEVAVKARLAFLVAETYLESTTQSLRPFPNGWLVHAEVDAIGLKSRAVLSRLLGDGFVANDVAFSPYSPDTASVIAVAGNYPLLSLSLWDVQTFVATESAIVNAFATETPSIKAIAPCWRKLDGTLDSTTCSYCLSAEKLRWVNNDIMVAFSSNLLNSDTVLAWFRRVQDIAIGSSVLAPSSSIGFTCIPQRLAMDDFGVLYFNGSSRVIAKCSSASCPEAIFDVSVTQTGTPASQATAMIFDSFSNVTYIALRVNSGNSASVLAKCSVTATNFAVYGLLTLKFVLNSLARSRAEIILALAIANRARMMFAAVSGVQSLTVMCILLYEIKSIAPNIADQRNATLITVIGTGFTKVPIPPSGLLSYDTNCKFGATVTPATIRSSTEMTCYVPIESETSSAKTCGSQILEVSLYNETFFTENLVEIQRAQSAKLLRVDPVRGTMQSAVPQVVNITGTGFQNSTFSRCKFYSNNSLSRQPPLLAPVTLITPNLIQCIQPNASEPSYDTALLDVSIDGQLYTIDGPLVYEIVGEATGILNEPKTINVVAQEQTFFSLTSCVVDERLHKLDSLDTENRTFYLLLNATYNSDCSLTSWRPKENCIPNFFLADGGSYPNATADGTSRFPTDPCYNATLNGVSNPWRNWSMTTETENIDTPYPIGFPNTSRIMYQGVKAIALHVGPHKGNVSFNNLFFYAPRVSNVTLTVVLVSPRATWFATTTIIVSAGEPFALAIHNIGDFQSYTVTGNQSANCAPTLRSKVFITLNTPIAQIDLVIVDKMANTVAIPVNQYLVTAYTYYIQDYDLVRKDQNAALAAPTQRDNKFIYSEIILSDLHGASHYVHFNATDRVLGRSFNTTTPPIRTSPSACTSDQYKVPLTQLCRACSAGENSDGLQCDGSELVTVLPGYWRANGSTTNAYKCPGGPLICLGSQGATNLTFCRAGHEGPLCAACAPGHGKSGNDCVPCQDISASASIVGVVIFVVFVVLIVWTIITLTNAETTDLSVIMRTVVNHMQATGELGAFASNYGPFLQAIMSGQGSAGGSVSVNGVQAFDCLIRGSGQNYYATFAGFMSLPVVAFVLAIVVFGVVRALKMKPVITPQLEKEIRQDIDNFGDNARTAIILERYPMFMVVVTTNCVIMFTLYQNIITQCANALQCKSFVYYDEYGAATSSKSFLTVDYSIPCDGSTSPLTTPALIFAALYGLGIPVIFTFGYLFVNDTVNMPELTKLMFLFLCGGYKEKFFFWQNLIMIRKLILVLMMVFLKDSPELLSYCAMWVMTIALALQVWLQPAEKDDHNLVESISLSVIVITLNLGLLYFWPPLIESDVAKNSLTMILILITLGVGLVFIYFMAPAVRDLILEVYVDARGAINKLLAEEERKKKRLKLQNLHELDDDIPDITASAPPRPTGGLHALHQARYEQADADFDEYSDNDEEGEYDERHDIEQAQGYVPPTMESKITPHVTKTASPAGWDFAGVSSPQRAPQQPQQTWRPSVPHQEERYVSARPRTSPKAYYDDL